MKNQHLISFHLHIPHINCKDQDDPTAHMKRSEIRKGCLSIMVGHEEEEEMQKFVVPVMYVNHPLFMELLKEAEEEFGFNQKGPITIPCHVEEFRHVQELINKEHHHHHHHHHNHNQNNNNHHHHHHHVWCFN